MSDTSDNANAIYVLAASSHIVNVLAAGPRLS